MYAFYSMSFAANIAVVMVAAIMIAFYIYTLLMYTNTRSFEAEYKTSTHIRRGSYPQ